MTSDQKLDAKLQALDIEYKERDRTDRDDLRRDPNSPDAARPSTALHMASVARRDRSGRGGGEPDSLTAEGLNALILARRAAQAS